MHALVQVLERLPGRRLTAAAVVPSSPEGLVTAGLRLPLEKALAASRKSAADRGLALETLLLQGEPHEALGAAARDYGCDLVVVGRRGYGLPPGAHMGKVTERVIGFSPTDVLVVPMRGRLAFDRLLLPVDGSRFSRRAAHRALELAGEFGGALRPISVLDAPPGFLKEVPEVAQDLLKHLEDLVGGVARQAADRRVPCETRVAVGPAYRLIVEAAREHEAGLIVMGSHGRTGLRRLLMGSVTERVVGQAPCAVLVVKTGGG